MEWIYLCAGFAVAALCICFYKKGLADGMRLQGAVPAVKKPAVLQTAEEKERQRELEQEREQERALQEQFAALVNYQPEYTAVRK